MSHHRTGSQKLSRREVLKNLGLAPLILRQGSLGASFLFDPPASFSNQHASFSFADLRLTPHYPVKSPLADVLALVVPGSDEYVSEKYASEIDATLKQWSAALQQSVSDLSVLATFLDPSIQASSLADAAETPLRSGYGIDAVRRQFRAGLVQGRTR